MWPDVSLVYIALLGLYPSLRYQYIILSILNISLHKHNSKVKHISIDTKLYICSWYICPDSWMFGIVKTLFKKIDSTIASNYRPKCWLHSLSLLWEHFIILINTIISNDHLDFKSSNYFPSIEISLNLLTATLLLTLYISILLKLLIRNHANYLSLH